tara:strand:- start:1610 stop:1879 length:270 start_codon:yes stop_codon:yes gene_type:complete
VLGVGVFLVGGHSLPLALFLPPLEMFDTCSLINKICPHCTHVVDYSKPLQEMKTEYCGMITGGDTTTKKLEVCWLKMSTHQKTKHRKTT